MGTLLKVSDLATRLSVPEQTIYAWVRFGKIDCIRLGRRIRFTEESVRAFLETPKTGHEVGGGVVA